MISYPKAISVFLSKFWPLKTQVKYDSAFNLLCSLGFMASLQGVRLEQVACANLFFRCPRVKKIKPFNCPGTEVGKTWAILDSATL